MTTENINITINLFAKPKELLNASSVTIQVPSRSSIKYCIEILGIQYPQIKETLQRSRIAKDCKYIDTESVLCTHTVLTLIPPISGG
jgi:hypothetical protein